MISKEGRGNIIFNIKIDPRACTKLKILYMWWLIGTGSRCGGSLVAHQTSGAEVPGSNPASTTIILMRCRIIVK